MKKWERKVKKHIKRWWVLQKRQNKALEKLDKKVGDAAKKGEKIS
jgi:hypothetical protein